MRAALSIALLPLLPLLAAPAPAQEALANPLAREPLAGYSATRERPLFAPSRRPPPPPVVARQEPEPPPPPPEPPNVTLLGVVSDESGPRALVRPGPMDKVRGVRIGDEIGGWTIAAIEATRIVLALEARAKTVALFESRPRPPAKAVARKNGR